MKEETTSLKRVGKKMKEESNTRSSNVQAVANKLIYFEKRSTAK